MILRKTTISIVLCLAALLPMAAVLRAASGDKSKEVLQLAISFEAPNVCRVSVGDQSFLMPEQDDALLAALEPLVEKGRVLSIVGAMEIPYRCIGHTIYTAQRAGFKKVGFVAEPPEA
jgi:biopolymer transport protein ExbD